MLPQENNKISHRNHKQCVLEFNAEQIKVIENTLAEIYSRLLPKRSSGFGIHDNFFESGGDSLTAIDLVSQAKAQGFKISVNHIFEHPTICGLANKIYEEAKKNTVKHSSSNIVSKTLDLLPNQTSYAFTNSMTIIVYLLRPTFTLNKERLEKSIQLLIQRHEALRIRFVNIESKWMQITIPYSLEKILKYICFENKLTEEQRSLAILEYYHKLMLSIDVEDNKVALRTALFEWEEEQLFFLAIDHYSVDEVSMKLFWKELFSIYMEKSLPAIEIPYSIIVNNLYHLAEGWNWREDQQYWLKQHSKIVHIPKTVSNTIESEGIKAKSRFLQNNTWLDELIFNIPNSTGIQIHEVLLTNWVQSLCLWSGMKGVVVILGSHNRELMDGMVHTMGCFVTAYPIYLEAPSAENTKQAIDFIRNQLKQVPYKGMKYMFSMIADPKWKETIFNAPQPFIGFNFLGQEEFNYDMWQECKGEEFKGKLVSIRKGELLLGRHQVTNSIPYLIMLCQVNNEHKTLTLTCEYDSGYYDEKAIENLLEMYQSRIQLFSSELIGGSN